MEKDLTYRTPLYQEDLRTLYLRRFRDPSFAPWIRSNYSVTKEAYGNLHTLPYTRVMKLLRKHPMRFDEPFHFQMERGANDEFPPRQLLDIRVLGDSVLVHIEGSQYKTGNLERDDLRSLEVVVRQVFGRDRFGYPRERRVRDLETDARGHACIR